MRSKCLEISTNGQPKYTVSNAGLSTHAGIASFSHFLGYHQPLLVYIHTVELPCNAPKRHIVQQKLSSLC